MNFVNIGILGHVDAGKTSLTERLLFDTGVIDHIGSVDTGDTQTDSLELERRRGITIRSAVVSFPVDDLQVNVIDTPGHSDFVAEVERAMQVLDGATLLISAVEGIQSRTRVLMRSLARQGIPVIIFVNKIDRMGARCAELLGSISGPLVPNCIAMGSVSDIGTAQAQVTSFTTDDESFTDRLADLLSERNQSFLAAYLDGSIRTHDYHRELADQTRRGWVYPVFFGSAITGAGIGRLVGGIAELLPRSRPSDDDEPLRATVFKIERGRAGERIASVRTYRGTINPRDRVRIHRRERGGNTIELESRVTTVHVFDRGTASRDTTATAGTIAKLGGLSDVQIGDQLGTADGLPARGALFPPPTLETVIRAINQQDKPQLFAALQRLAEQDPLIDVRRNDSTGSISVQLYGEVQKEVIASTLAETFGIEVAFEDSRVIYIEKPVGRGDALQEFAKNGPNFFWATVGLRIEPSPLGAGITFRSDVHLGSLLHAFHIAIEETVRETLRGGLYGWEVRDCAVTLTHSGYDSVLSTAGDFRSLTPLVVGEALKHAGTTVYEPVHRFELETPTDTVISVRTALAAARATPDDHIVSARTCRLRGMIPVSTVHWFTQRLPELTRGEGILVTEFEGYRPVFGPAPTRKRAGANPYDREQYMLHVQGRV